MWAEWFKSPRNSPKAPRSLQNSPKAKSSPRFFFSSSTLKDVQALAKEEDQLFKPEPCGSVREFRTLKKSSSIFHRVRNSTSLFRSWVFNHQHHHPNNHHKPSKSFGQASPPPPPNSEHYDVVLYYTTLHIVRKTYEDCRAVRSALRGFHVPIDERDLSMDATYVEELQEITGSKKLDLPVVFIGGKYIHGAEEVMEMHETGELSKLIGGLRSLGDSKSCDLCGGFRFLVCQHCYGSHKIHIENSSGFRSCTACNVNGLIKCPYCFPVYRRRMSL